MMPVLPNIYVDANRSKRGIVLDLKTPRGPGAAARPRGGVGRRGREHDGGRLGAAWAWRRARCGRSTLRSCPRGPRASGWRGRWPAVPAFDYVVQAATGMEMTQGGGVSPVPVNFTANDYGTGLLLGAGIVLALLGRSRGVAVTGVDASLALTATVFQSEDVAALATVGFCSRSGRGGPARCRPCGNTCIEPRMVG